MSQKVLFMIVIQFLSFERSGNVNNTERIIDISLVVQIHCSSPEKAGISVRNQTIVE